MWFGLVEPQDNDGNKKTPPLASGGLLKKTV